MSKSFLNEQLAQKVYLLIGELARQMQIRRASVPETAAAIGISAQHLYRLIAGSRRPSLDILQRWAALYGLKIDFDMGLAVDSYRLTMRRK